MSHRAKTPSATATVSSLNPSPNARPVSGRRTPSDTITAAATSPPNWKTGSKLSGAKASIGSSPPSHWSPLGLRGSDGTTFLPILSKQQEAHAQQQRTLLQRRGLDQLPSRTPSPTAASSSPLRQRPQSSPAHLSSIVSSLSRESFVMEPRPPPRAAPASSAAVTATPAAAVANFIADTVAAAAAAAAAATAAAAEGEINGISSDLDTDCPSGLSSNRDGRILLQTLLFWLSRFGPSSHDFAQSCCAALAAACSNDTDCGYLIKLGCCKILRKLYAMKQSHDTADDSEGKKLPQPDAVHAVVVPVAMVTSAFSVLQPLLYAGYAADLCAAGLLNDIGDLFAHSEQLDADALCALMGVTQTLCESGAEVKAWMHRMRVPGSLVDIFCVSEIDSSSSSSSSITITCLTALRACIVDHPPCKRQALEGGVVSRCLQLIERPSLPPPLLSQILWILHSLFADESTRALLSNTTAAAAAAPMIVRLLALDVTHDVMLPALSVMRTLMYKAAATRQIVVENHGLRVLLRLLARSLPSACLSELFGCLMNVAADVGGQLELLKLSFFPAVFAAAPGLGVLESALEGREEQTSAVSCGEDWAVEYAGVVRNMLYHSERATEAMLASPGFIDHVVSMVASASNWDVVLHACGALRNVAFTNAVGRKALLDHACVPALARVLSSPDGTVEALLQALGTVDCLCMAAGAASKMLQHNVFNTVRRLALCNISDDVRFQCFSISARLCHSIQVHWAPPSGRHPLSPNVCFMLLASPSLKKLGNVMGTGGGLATRETWKGPGLLGTLFSPSEVRGLSTDAQIMIDRHFATSRQCETPQAIASSIVMTVIAQSLGQDENHAAAAAAAAAAFTSDVIQSAGRSAAFDLPPSSQFAAEADAGEAVGEFDAFISSSDRSPVDATEVRDLTRARAFLLEMDGCSCWEYESSSGISSAGARIQHFVRDASATASPARAHMRFPGIGGRQEAAAEREPEFSAVDLWTVPRRPLSAIAKFFAEATVDLFVLYFTGSSSGTSGDWVFEGAVVTFADVIAAWTSVHGDGGVHVHGGVVGLPVKGRVGDVAASGQSPRLVIICDCSHSGSWVHKAACLSPALSSNIAVQAACSDAQNALVDSSPSSPCGVFSQEFFGPIAREIHGRVVAGSSSACGPDLRQWAQKSEWHVALPQAFCGWQTRDSLQSVVPVGAVQYSPSLSTFRSEFFH